MMVKLYDGVSIHSLVEYPSDDSNNKTCGQYLRTPELFSENFGNTMEYIYDIETVKWQVL